MNLTSIYFGQQKVELQEFFWCLNTWKPFYTIIIIIILVVVIVIIPNKSWALNTKYIFICVFSVNLTISINWLLLTASINVKLSKRIACALCREFMESVFHLLKINDTLNKQSKWACKAKQRTTTKRTMTTIIFSSCQGWPLLWNRFFKRKCKDDTFHGTYPFSRTT